MNKKLLLIIPLMFLLILTSLVTATIDWDNDVNAFIPLMNVTNSDTGLLDLSPNNNNGTAYGGVTFFNSSQDSFSFDGTDDYVDLNYKTQNNQFTLSTWVNIADSSFNPIISNSWRSTTTNGIIYSGITTDKYVQFAIYNDGAWTYPTGTTALTIGNWYLVTATYDGSTMKIYLNDNLENSASVSYSTFPEVDNWRIGQKKSSSTETYFTGKLNSPTIYNKALTSTEISDLYNEGRTYNPYGVSTQYIDITTNTEVNYSCSNSTTTQTGTTTGNTVTTSFIEGDSISCTFTANNYYDQTANSQTTDFTVTMAKKPYIKVKDINTGSYLTNFSINLNDNSGLCTTTTTNGSCGQNEYSCMTETRTTTNGIIYFDGRTYTSNLIQIDTNQTENYLFYSNNNLNVSDNAENEYSIWQTCITPQATEIFSNNTLSNVTFYYEGGAELDLHPPVDTYNITAKKNNYFDLTKEFTFTPLEEETTTIPNMYNSVLNFTLQDSLTSSALSQNTSLTIVNDDEGTNITTSNTNGSYSINLIKGNYTIYASSNNYADNNLTFLMNDTYQNESLVMYSANSIWITSYDSGSGITLTGFNATIYNTTTIYSINDNNTGTAKGLNISAGIYTVKISKSGYSDASYTVTMTGGSHQDLKTYLTSNTANVILTIKNALNSGIIPGATVSQYQIINSTWTLINSMLSDITGRTQFTYGQGIEYKFTITKNDYETKSFQLTPLFASYDVVLTPETTEETNYNQGQYFYEVNPQTFYDEQINNLTFTINSGAGTLENYTINIIAPNVNQTHNYSNAIGGTYDYSINISGATIEDFVTITYNIKETGKATRTFVKVYPIINKADEGTLSDWNNQETGLGKLGKATIATIIILILVGVVATASSMLGVSALIPSALTFLVMTIIFGMIDFIPKWSIYISGIAMLMIIFFSLKGE